MTDQQAYAKGDQGSDGPANPIARRYSRWSHGPAEIAEDKKAAGVTEINAKVTFYVRRSFCPAVCGFSSKTNKDLLVPVVCIVSCYVCLATLAPSQSCSVSASTKLMSTT